MVYAMPMRANGLLGGETLDWKIGAKGQVRTVLVTKRHYVPEGRRTLIRDSAGSGFKSLMAYQRGL